MKIGRQADGYRPSRHIRDMFAVFAENDSTIGLYENQHPGEGVVAVAEAITQDACRSRFDRIVYAIGNSMIQRNIHGVEFISYPYVGTAQVHEAIK